MAGPAIEGRIWDCIITGELTFTFYFIYERVSGPGGNLRSADGWLVFGVLFSL